MNEVEGDEMDVSEKVDELETVEIPLKNTEEVNFSYQPSRCHT